MLTARLFGLGDPTPVEADQIAALLATGSPTPEVIRDFLLMLPTKQWTDTATVLMLKGVSPLVVSEGLRLARAQGRPSWKMIAPILTLASASVSAYHGVRRNKSVGWGIWWFVMGATFPLITPTIALAQGFGRSKEK